MSKRSNWSIPYVIFLVFFVALPLVLVMVYAFQDGQGRFTLENITKFFTDRDALSTFAVSIEVALENTGLCILLGYPAAWILANKQYNKSAVTIVLFIMPMWINALMRTLATAQLFTMLGITLGKGTLLFGMVYDYLPFMIYPIYNVLAKMDKSYAEAAVDLGATPWTAFWKVTVPLSMPGVTSGILMVFMPTVSTFAISEVHAHGVHLRHLRVPHEQQDQAVRYHHPGEHQLLHVELRRGPGVRHAHHHRYHHPVRQGQGTAGRRPDLAL